MQSPEMQQLLQNPEMLQAFLQQMGPQMAAMQGGAGGMPPLFNPANFGGPAMPAPPAIELSQEDNEAIERLQALGFPRNDCIQAFLACDKNENLAANFLLNDSMGP